MAQIDNFASVLLEEAKRFLEKARSDASEEGQPAYLHAALMLAFSSLEAHINAIADDEHTALSAHEIGLLKERQVQLEDGEFKVKTGLQISRLEDRIQFLYRKFGGAPIDRSVAWWSELRTASDLRNKLFDAHDGPAQSAR